MNSLKIHFRSLLDAGTIYNPIPLWKSLKDEVYKEKLFEIIFNNLSHEGFLNNKALLVDYPSHKPHKDNNLITQEIINKLKPFGSKYLVDILSRWKPTIDKSYIRSRRLHSKVSFEDEINSLVLWNQKIIRDRIIILIDDFTTTGLSLEAGRNLFSKAEVEKVVLCSFGKFCKNAKHKMYIPEINFDPFAQKDKIKKGQYTTKNISLSTDTLVREDLQKYLI